MRERTLNTLIISSDTRIDATGHFVTVSTITGTNATNAVRLFEIEPDVTLEIINLRLADGRSTNGAAIFNGGGFLFATSCVFSNNQAVGFSGRNGADGRSSSDSSGADGRNGTAGTPAGGGAIYNIGTAVFNACSFLTNAAGGGAGGDGGNGGNGTFVGGDGGKGAPGGAALGGGIFNGGTLLVSNSTFNFNFVVGGAGGVGGVGGNSRAYIGFTGIGAGGGASQGGAIYNAITGGVTIVSSTFALNQAQGGDSAEGGSASSQGPNGLPGGGAFGGALCNFGTNTLINSSFFANAVAGGAGGSGSTARFQGGRGGNGGAAWGGGVYNYRRTLATNCTFSDGGAIGGTNGVGGEAPYAGKNGNRGISRGGNLANARGQFFLMNCVIAYGSPGTNGYGAFVNSGFNLSSDRSMILRGRGSMMNTNPLLGILSNNGGPTQTLALGDGSPAIDAGATNFCLPTDQRGVARPVGSRCDIGAYEYGVGLVAPTIVSDPQDAQVQVGGTVMFSVVAAGDLPLLYQWRRNGIDLDGETEPTLTLIGAIVDDAGDYDVVVSNNSGSIISAEAVLTVIEPVQIIDQPASVTVVPGGFATFGVTAEGDEPLSYQWLFNGVPILGARLSTFSVANAQPENSGAYQVVVSNPFSSETSLPAMLNVGTVPPSFVTPPVDQTVGVGRDVTFSATVDGTLPLRLRWFFNGTNLVAENFGPVGVFTVTNAQFANAGTYQVVVSNFVGVITSSPAALVVTDAPPIIVTQPVSVVTNTGVRVTFSVVANGSLPFGYRWFLDGSEITDETNRVLVLNNVGAEQAATYTVEVSNGLGAVISVPATLTIDDSVLRPANRGPQPRRRRKRTLASVPPVRQRTRY